MTNIVEVSTTLETADQARVLAQKLIDSRLAACVQIAGPIESVYNWNGKIRFETEYRCTIKSCRQLASQLMDLIDSQHPYDVPEVLVVEVTDCSKAYAEWLSAQIDV